LPKLDESPNHKTQLDAVPHYFPEPTQSNERRPLLLFLHGFGATGKLAFDVLKLAEFGQKNRVFVLAPEGTLDSKGRRFWNAHPACCNFDGQSVDHVRALNDLVDSMIHSYAVDAARVYVGGVSNGGFMAHRLACEWQDHLAGIVSIAGAGPANSQTCRPRKGLRILEIHGDADETVFYEGGTLFDRPHAVYGSAKSTFEDWANRLGCGTRAPGSSPPFDLVANLPGEETHSLNHENCKSGSVALWTVHGGSHLFGNRLSVLEQAWRYLNPDLR
jgi:polyhydroxybutyrate depolymerase